MYEATKTHRIRGSDFVPRYLAGKAVLDIGCGPDLVVPWAQPFDLVDGDANRIASFLQPQSYDVVHSSHCLEHMFNPPEALVQWWSLVKPGGYLITVVPDEEMYEQGLWPSIFNKDHKWAFTLDPQRMWSPHVLDLKAVHQQLPGAELIDLQKHDLAYRHELREATRKNLSAVNYARYRRALSWVERLHLQWLGLDRVGWDWLTRHGVPIDQTQKDATAQLQIIMQKNRGQS